jgi:MarR family transcriptional regulator, transcriptional regulator for hemolysin
MVPPPSRMPVGLHLSQAARVVSQAFDDDLQAAGGSLPVWLVLLNLKVRRRENQRELAAAVGIREATLTHHLNSMERLGLLTRRRDPANRRVHLVELTKAGEESFLRLRDAAMAFNQRLTGGFSDVERDGFGALLDRLVANVGGSNAAAPPWAGLAEPSRSPGRSGLAPLASTPDCGSGESARAQRRKGL